MKPELLFVVLLIVHLQTIGSEPCQYISDSSGGKIVCLNTEKMEYMSSVQFLKSQIQDTVNQNEEATLAIEIRNSNIPEIGEWLYLPWSISGDYMSKICSVSVVNSSVQIIKTSVLSKFALKQLDISYNHITSYSFLSDLPDTVEFLNVSFSEISDYSHIFNNLKSYILSKIFIDISNSKISGNVYLYDRIGSVDLSNNNVTLIKASDVGNINLSGNKNLSISESKWDNVSLSMLNYDLIKQLKYSIGNALTIKNTKVGKLTLNADFTINQVFRVSQPSLDISNIEITDIDDKYFENDNLNLLNLSNNNIPNIKNLVFSYSNINILDLSNSYIEFLDSTVFSNASFQKLILSNNNLKSLDGVFDNIKKITELDLSFNSLETVTKNTFKNCMYLQVLNLSNNFISTIADSSFADLLSLNHLELSFSKNILSESIKNVLLTQLVIRNSVIPQLTDKNFIGLPGLTSLSFPNSTISLISNDAFEGLRNVRQIKYFQFNVNIDYRNLISLTELDLSNQSINNLLIHLLKGMNNLKYLNLSNNLLSALDIDSFVDLENLEVLSLANNYFSLKQLPAGLFRNLKSLTHLYLNKQTGSVGINLGIFTNLRNLKVLDLSFTSLGNSPLYPVLQPLINLEILNLQNAALYGPALYLNDITIIATRFPALRKIDISYNSWSLCTDLSSALDIYKDNSVDFTPANPVYDRENIYGIVCSSY